MYDVARMKADQKRIVSTNTLEKLPWKNAELAKGDIKTEITKLKFQNGKDIIVYGCSSFVSSLIKEGFVDEFHF